MRRTTSMSFFGAFFALCRKKGGNQKDDNHHQTSRKPHGAAEYEEIKNYNNLEELTWKISLIS